MNKIEKITVSVPPISGAQQLYLVGTYNLDGTPLLQTQAFVCYIPGPPEGNIIAVVASNQMKDNIVREQAFSLNLCNVEMRALAESAFGGYFPEKNEEKELGYLNGTMLNVPILGISPRIDECKVTQSLQVGDTAIFISETICSHADSRFVQAYPESDDDVYDWYASQDAKKFDPLLYAFKYYTLSENIGQLGDKDL